MNVVQASSSGGPYVTKHVVVPVKELTELPRPTYECELCGLHVKTKANLRAHHIKTHRILKNDSDLAFFTKHKNTIHYVYHCPVVPCKHNIDHEGGGFASCSRLKQHFQNVHMSKTYTCERCKQRFPTPSAHAYHIKLCGNTYSCPVCSKTYSVRKLLLQHFRRSGHYTVSNTRSVSRKILNSVNRCTTVITNSSSTISGSATNDSPNEATTAAYKNPNWIPVFILPIPVPTFTKWNNTEINSCNLPFINSSSHEQTQQSPVAAALNLKPQFMTETGAEDPLNVQTPMCSTPTANVDAAVDATTPGSCNTSVSVNIGTDEDDITAFLGTLFCDASVETNFPTAQLVHEYTDTGLDASGTLDTAQSSNQFTDTTFDAEDLHNDQTFMNFHNLDSSHLSSHGVEKLHSQTITLSGEEQLRESMTEFTMGNSQSHCNSTLSPVRMHSLHAQDAYFSSIRPLETPPPTRPQNSSHLLYRGDLKLLPNDDDTFHTKESGSSTLASVAKPPNILCAFDEGSSLASGGTLDANFAKEALPCFQSIGLQSNLWSPSAPMCSSMETQTMDANLDSWLNSVHTQTSTSAFDLHTLTDMCVGVDDDFLAAAFGCVEDETQCSDQSHC